MAASKTSNYSTEILNLSMIGRALAHPARVKIITLLEEGNLLTNQNLCEILKLNKTTIHTHLKKMYEADLITGSYQNKYSIFSRTKEHRDLVALFVKNVKAEIQ